MSDWAIFRKRILDHLECIYQGVDISLKYDHLTDKIFSLMRFDAGLELAKPHVNHWSEQDVYVITYGDTIIEEENRPLVSLKYFLDKYLSDGINGVHILPFFPYSSDDGFSVIDYSTVNPSHGNWDEINAIADDYRLMSDLVINHCSARSLWFENFLQDKKPGADYFATADLQDDLSKVVRPRTSSLLRPVQTVSGEKHVWCTFSHDQADLNFKNPEVLLEFIKIIRLYLDQGVNIFRLDAVAFLWKEVGTNCLNLVQTHEIVRLLRSLIEHAVEDAVVITETNIPNRENLSYFGNANEAHAIYNFPLPPLLLHTLLGGNCLAFRTWLMAMPPAQNGTMYFNFIASHDGIGLRPAEGLLSSQEIDQMVQLAQSFGGRISWRALDDNVNKPYEINISLIDALKGTCDGVDNMQLERFVCAHAIMLGIEGVAGIYIHSFLATENDYKRLEHTGHNRSINRHQWVLPELEGYLADSANIHSKALAEFHALLKIRRQQPAFHPNAAQFTLQLGDEVLGFWRQSMDRKQSIFCIHNITNRQQSLTVSTMNLVEMDQWQDLLSGLKIQHSLELLVLEPYQSMWISNKYDSSSVAKA